MEFDAPGRSDLPLGTREAAAHETHNARRRTTRSPEFCRRARTKGASARPVHGVGWYCPQRVRPVWDSRAVEASLAVQRPDQRRGSRPFQATRRSMAGASP